MRRIAVTDGMADEAVKKLEQAGCEVVRQFIELQDLHDGALAEFDAVIVRSATKITKEVLEASLPRLKVVARAGVGVDNIDIDAASVHGTATAGHCKRARRLVRSVEGRACALDALNLQDAACRAKSIHFGENYHCRDQ